MLTVHAIERPGTPERRYPAGEAGGPDSLEEAEGPRRVFQLKVREIEFGGCALEYDDAKARAGVHGLTYEPGMTVADGDLVMVHGRYTGWGPKPMVAVDIFRVENGKVVEHWDVMQEEVPASDTASGNAMFTRRE